MSLLFYKFLYEMIHTLNEWQAGYFLIKWRCFLFFTYFTIFDTSLHGSLHRITAIGDSLQILHPTFPSHTNLLLDHHHIQILVHIDLLLNNIDTMGK